MAWGALHHHDAFRLLCSQRVAVVGRTTAAPDADGLSLDAVWARIREGVGLPLNRDALHFGHRACNIVCPLFVVSVGDRREVLECVPEGDERGLEIMSRLLGIFGGLGPILTSPVRGILRRVAVALGNPGTAARAIVYGLGRAWRMRLRLASIARDAVRERSLRIRPWILVVHRFMSPDELATPLGRERLEACVFRLPVEGRMVSMCELNATDLRLRLNRAGREAGPASPISDRSDSTRIPTGTVRRIG